MGHAGSKVTGFPVYFQHAVRKDKVVLLTIRRILLYMLIICPFVILSSCTWDRHVGERPIDQPGTKWVSSDPYGWFKVADPAERYCYGEIELDGEFIKIEVFFDYRKGVIASTSKAANTTIFYGECDFQDDLLIVTISSKGDFLGQHPHYILDESIDSIEFSRE